MTGHRYLPTGSLDLEEMMAALGISSIDELFASLPDEIRLAEPPAVDGPLSDQELRRHFQGLAGENLVPAGGSLSFLGAGAYRHEIPAAVDHLLNRTELFTVYTPYQPEVSQGTLQATFEFQTLISMLTGLPVANASLYDGGSGFAEAVLMADRLQRKRRRVVLSQAIHPHYRMTLRSYVQNLDLEIVEVGCDSRGRTDAAELVAAVDESTICVALQSPNYFGVIESWTAAAEVAAPHGALVIGVVAEALSLALLQSPGDGGCDIAVGEAQSFGLPIGFGGPYLGFLAARDKAKRAIPGRLVGQTVDVDGRRAWVLTLATREQHIRREKATSNICTNQALCAMAATIYLALHGKHGLRQLAELNLQRAAYLRRQIEANAPGFRARFDAPFFNEFTLECPLPAVRVLAALEAEGILGGVALGDDYPELANCILVAVTECNQPADLDRLAAALGRISATAGEAEGELGGGE